MEKNQINHLKRIINANGVCNLKIIPKNRNNKNSCNECIIKNKCIIFRTKDKYFDLKLEYCKEILIKHEKLSLWKKL